MLCRKRSNIPHEGCAIKCDRSKRWARDRRPSQIAPEKVAFGSRYGHGYPTLGDVPGSTTSRPHRKHVVARRALSKVSACKGTRILGISGLRKLSILDLLPVLFRGFPGHFSQPFVCRERLLATSSFQAGNLPLGLKLHRFLPLTLYIPAPLTGLSIRVWMYRPRWCCPSWLSCTEWYPTVSSQP